VLESMPISTVAAKALAACCLPILLLTFDVPVASAQCSQAGRSAVVFEKTTAPAQDAPPVSASNASSSSNPETADTVRFAPGAAITVLEGTPLQVINDTEISSRTTKAGAKLSFTVTRDVVADGILVIPCGATVFGTVASAKQAGRLVGSSYLTLELTELNLGGRSYPLYTPPFKVVGTSKTSSTVNKVAIGATVGAVAMDSTVPGVNYKISAPDRAKGDGIVAGVGAGVGTAIAAASPPSIALIPAESQIEFTLASPVAVYPVDQHVAARLAQGMHHGGPVLYVRGESQ
jgi:hypothetical protein